MIYYHRTAAAADTVTHGFCDASASYGLVGITRTGVFISDQPLGTEDEADGDQLLMVSLPQHVDLRDYEIAQDSTSYREWCVPAELLNRWAHVKPVSDADNDIWQTEGGRLAR